MVGIILLNEVMSEFVDSFNRNYIDKLWTVIYYIERCGIPAYFYFPEQIFFDLEA